MISDFLKPRTEDETVIQILTGPKWNGASRHWEWAFFAYFWNLAPAYCGKCGRCTNPDNVEPCGHPEAQKHVRGQIFITSLEDFEKRILSHDRVVRYKETAKKIIELAKAAKADRWYVRRPTFALSSLMESHSSS